MALLVHVVLVVREPRPRVCYCLLLFAAMQGVKDLLEPRNPIEFRNFRVSNLICVGVGKQSFGLRVWEAGGSCGVCHCGILVQMAAAGVGLGFFVLGLSSALHVYSV